MRGTRASLRTMGSALASVALVTTFLLAPLPAETSAGAAVPPCSTSWTNSAGGDWATPSNWSAGVPTSTSVACVTLGGTYTVSIAGWDDTASALRLGAKHGTQTLDFLPNCDKAAYLTLHAASTVGPHGIIDLEPATTCASNAVLTQDGRTFVNNGLIHAIAGATVINQLQVNLVNNGDLVLDSAAGSNSRSWTNNGTIEIADGVEASVGGNDVQLVNNGAIAATGSGSIVVRGTYVQGQGTTTGATPVVVLAGRIHYTGDGKSTVVARSESTTLAGNLAPHQKLVIEADCDEGSAVVEALADWTNRGTVVLTRDCGDGSARLEGEVTVTNLGTIQTKGEATLDEDVVNKGTLKIGAGTVNTFDAHITNAPSGTLSVQITGKTHYAHLFDATLQLAGTLVIATADKYWPAAHTTFPIADAGSSTGTFTTVSGTTRTGESVTYHVAYSADGVKLTT